MPDNRLNSLTEAMLDGEEPDPLLVGQHVSPVVSQPVAPRVTYSAPLQRESSYRQQLKALVLKCSYRKRVLVLAWRCLYCNTLNGMQGKKDIVRKTCSKCCKYRTNKLTFQEELNFKDLKGEKADLIKEIARMKEIDLQDAFLLFEQVSEL